jgi:hypothetical protein
MTDITLDEYLDCLHGYNIVDCSVRNRMAFHFVAREDYTRWPKDRWDSENEPPPDETAVLKHVIAYFRDDPESARWSRAEISGFETSYSGVSQKPKVQHVVVTMGGDVYAAGSGDKGIETSMKPYDNGGPSRGGIHKLRTIDGWLYFCGGNNSVGKRTAKGEWFAHTPNVPDPKRTDHRYNSFDDIDGFAEDDLYCVGSEGQVYHFDGHRWQRLAFPSNVDLETVCCAGDGQVYVSGRKGMTFRGRGERWELISPGGNMSLPFRDMVWHEDRVWCTSDYGVWTIHDGKLESAELPDGIKAYAGNLAAADGVLLLAGYGGAAFLEGGRWTKVFSAGEMSRAAKARAKP